MLTPTSARRTLAAKKLKRCEEDAAALRLYVRCYGNDLQPGELPKVKARLAKLETKAAACRAILEQAK